MTTQYKTLSQTERFFFQNFYGRKILVHRKILDQLATGIWRAIWIKLLCHY